MFYFSQFTTIYNKIKYKCSILQNYFIKLNISFSLFFLFCTMTVFKSEQTKSINSVVLFYSKIDYKYCDGKLDKVNKTS